MTHLQYSRVMSVRLSYKPPNDQLSHKQTNTCKHLFGVKAM